MNARDSELSPSETDPATKSRVRTLSTSGNQDDDADRSVGRMD